MYLCHYDEKKMLQWSITASLGRQKIDPSNKVEYICLEEQDKHS